MQKSQATNKDNQPTTDPEIDDAVVSVIDADGVRGWLDGQELQKVGNDQIDAQVSVRFGERVVLVDRDALVPEGQNLYRLPLRLKDIDFDASSEAEIRTADSQRTVIPVIKEEMRVEKQTVEATRVHIVKRVHSHEEELDVPLVHKEVHVERIPVNKFVDEAPAARREGETLILPVLEEVLVLEKKLRLKEEVHITSRESETVETVRTTLREEEISVERKHDTQS